MFRTLFGGTKKKISEEKLPAMHSFVDVTVAGRSVKSVSVEEIGSREIVVGDLVGRTGESAVFVYQNAAGKFRFSTRILGARQGMSVFEMPESIDTVGAGGSQKRTSVRLDTLVSGFWRFAPGGKGVGEWVKGSIRDISRGGCALIADRPFKMGQMVEIKMDLRSNVAPVTVLGEVMRAEQIPTSGKYSHGLRFHGIRPEEDQAILEFINRRQSELRNRGLA